MVASSSSAPTTRPAAGRIVDAGYSGRYRAAGTVLEAPGKGPRLCLGAIATSLPPQCDGPKLVGWSWDAVPGAQESMGTRWGSYAVVGRYDGTSFTLTGPATVPGPSDAAPVDRPDFDTPCPEPSGGWVPTDRTKATDAAFEKARQLAEHQDGFGALWVDQRGHLDNGPAAGSTNVANDPTYFVLNASTTKDVAAMERTLRTVWGGPLCVSRARRTAAELARTTQSLSTTPGVLSISSDDRAGQVELTVIRATTELRHQLDDRFGPGTVRLVGALQPID